MPASPTAPPPPAAKAAPRPAKTAAPAAPRRYANMRDFLRALGDIPLERIVFDPWPGTATEADCLLYGERSGPAEMIDNALVEKAVGYWEESIGSLLLAHMRIHADTHDLGIVNGAAAQMRVVGGNIRLPDVTFVTKARAPTRDLPVPDLSPDLIVEVLSAGNTPAEIDRKLREFFAGGTRLAWVVDRRSRTVAVHRGAVGPAVVLTEADALDGEDVLPGFAMPVADLFAGLPRE